MRAIWVTGASGAGKSAVSRRLTALGHRAVSTDSVDGLCRWVGDDGVPAERPAQPDRAWLATHHWVWHPAALDRLMRTARRAGDNTLFLCGYAANALELSDRFDLVVLLRIDMETMLTRLDDPARGNDFGRIGQSREHLLATFDDWQRRLQLRADVVLDATVKLDAVVDRVLRAAAAGQHS